MSRLHSFRYLWLAAALALAFSVPALAAPSVLAESAILINARTGGVIFEKNADIRRAPASMTKMMKIKGCRHSNAFVVQTPANNFFCHASISQIRQNEQRKSEGTRKKNFAWNAKLGYPVFPIYVKSIKKH